MSPLHCCIFLYGLYYGTLHPFTAVSFCMGWNMSDVTLSLLYLSVWAVLWHMSAFHCCTFLYGLEYGTHHPVTAVSFCMAVLWYTSPFHCSIFLDELRYLCCCWLYYGAHHSFHCCIFLYWLEYGTHHPVAAVTLCMRYIMAQDNTLFSTVYLCA